MGHAVPEKIKILPWGNVKSRKGTFRVDKESYDCILKYYNERGVDIVIDYEHQTLGGEQAPAAGWIKELSCKVNDGIYAVVEWTEKAKEYLKNKEYRYLSPVILKRKEDGKAVQLHSIGLTNTPAIDEMTAIVNKLSKEGTKKYENNDSDKEEGVKEIAQMLGLPDDSTTEQVVEAIQILNANAMNGKQPTVACKDILDVLELKDDATAAEAKEKITALKNHAGYVSMEEFLELKKSINQKESGSLVQLALSEGKVTPAMKDWAEQIALKDPDGFKEFLENAPVMICFKEINYKKDEQPKDLNPEISINKMLGISSEDVKKYGYNQNFSR